MDISGIGNRAQTAAASCGVAWMPHLTLGFGGRRTSAAPGGLQARATVRLTGRS